METPLDFAAAMNDVALQLGERQAQILARWRKRVSGDPQIVGISHMTRSQFNDHIPLILDTFCAKLSAAPNPSQDLVEENEAKETEMAQQHSQHRWQQGYQIRSLVREWGHLNSCVIEALDSLPLDQSALSPARSLWAEFVGQNVGEGVAEYESLLQSEAGSRLGDLESALDTMRLLEAERGEMLREVSHDLRGGLSVVSGASSLLGHEKMNDADRDHVVSILQSGVRSVTQMLGDLMTIARLEAGHEKRENLAFDAGQLLRQLGIDAQLLAGEKGLFLRAEGPQSFIVQGDSSKVHRIAQNLLLNALKYTHSGGVILSWQAISDTQWSLTLSDTGPGLARSNAAPLAGKIAKATDDAQEIGAQPGGESPSGPSQTEKLKTPAAEVKSAPDGASTLTLQPGEGIGLSIVRRLCELLDATLELESGAGQGSTFRVVLPRFYTKGE